MAYAVGIMRRAAGVLFFAASLAVAVSCAPAAGVTEGTAVPSGSVAPDDSSEAIERAADIVRVQGTDHGGSQVWIGVAKQQVAEDMCGRTILNLSGHAGQFKTHFGVWIFGQRKQRSGRHFRRGG